MSIERKRILVVLGMHRSGTSAITRGLEVLGIELGKSLMPAAKDNNDKGFFEDVDFHALNSRLLAELGGGWDKLSTISIDRLREPRFAPLMDDAKRILSDKLAATRHLGLKDPQASLLLPFWQDVFAQLDIEAHYLICFRNPLSVAASLYKRDGMPPVRAQLLWAKYSLAALRHSLALQPLVVDYDALMENPKQQLARIAEAFGMPDPDSAPAAFEAFSQEFLSQDLRHSSFGQSAVDDPRRVLGVVRDIHELLHSAARQTGRVGTSDLGARCGLLEEQIRALEPIARELDTHNQHALSESLQHEREGLLSQIAKLQEENQDAWLEHNKVFGELERIRNHPVFRALRALKDYRGHSARLKTGVSRLLRHLWLSVPGSASQKLRAKAWLFHRGRYLFRHTRIYQNWLVSTGELALTVTSRNSPLPRIDEPVQYVPKLAVELSAPQPARLIAFYLPQFHEIPENNQWWGAGFTEWSNVRPAQPYYAGHYQPHIPSDLGYYNLENIDTQRQQIELAKLYGIAGFCFYFYWFGGKRLLEKPTENYLRNPDLDLPFCLCWANENWSRRWDGLDDQILIGQQHSAEDDLAFIAHIAQYLRDDRYIRIDGKPLLLIYRPGELPDAKATTSRWRKWCRENGIGEIYLAYTQSFDRAHPGKYGFDAAIEFPPNGTVPEDASDSVIALQESFSGKVYDWRTYLKRSSKFTPPKYPLFRGVCPSWDNTARRKERGTSFINSSPRGYQEWLFNAIRDTIQRLNAPDQRLVFINAWNEWAEGAHLEPDQRYGYGFLEASRMANLRAALQTEQPMKQQRSGLAVAVHAYYLDVFEEIIEHLEQIKQPLKLYISTPLGQAEAVHQRLARSHLEYRLLELPNHGRDILPFLKMLPLIVQDGFELLVKVHTKKSPHRNDGSQWRKELYAKLLAPDAVESAISSFIEDKDLGIIGPAGHVVPMNYYWGSNSLAVGKLSCRLGISPAELHRHNFVAGSMFLARVNALMPLMNLALRDDDFEKEAGQVDGTLAHAVERAISISAAAAGLRLRSFDGAASNKRYAYAEASM